MKKNDNISNAVVRRLPRYRRCLRDLLKNDIEKVSSGELSKLLGYTASQVRQDFNNFGGFGQQGYGYNVKELYEKIGQIIGLNLQYNLIIVGSQHIGQALANYDYYSKEGFNVIAMFDIDSSLVGKIINDIEILHYDKLDQYLKDNQVDIGVICTNKGSAQEVAEKLMKGNVRGIWNFAPLDIVADQSNAFIENVHLNDSLHALIYYINH